MVHGAWCMKNEVCSWPLTKGFARSQTAANRARAKRSEDDTREMPRRKPFSNKQKKQQLQQKRQRKKDNGKGHAPHCAHASESSSESEDGEPQVVAAKINQQPVTGSNRYDPNRYRLHFERESRQELEERKLLAKTTPITPVPEAMMEMSVEDIYRPGSVLDIPQRPPWTYKMMKMEVEAREETMFTEYLRNIYTRHKPEELSYFEHNLETWRQLWRVLEISDVVLLITDVRHPTVHFSPALYNYVVRDLKKQIILVLNKVDLVPPQVAVAWRHYFLSKFPKLNVLCFTSYPDREASLETKKKVSMKFRRKGCGKLPSAVGPHELFRVIEKMYRGTVDLAGWQQRLESVQTVGGDAETGEEPVAMATTTVISSPLESDEVSEGVLTIGMVGHPNVGKSSLLNGLMGKKLVSTSRTPGHTKHFQTIFLTPTVRLCDCPGLIFPSLIDKQLQVLSGLYPIAQVREPYTTVGYLAQRVPIVQLLRLTHPNADTQKKKTKPLDSGVVMEADSMGATNDIVPDELLDLKHDSNGCEVDAHAPVGDREEVWTAWDICDAWAEKRGYYTARAARFDTHRAANSILRLAVDGRISMYFRPPGYLMDKANWECHPEVADMIQLQRAGMAGRSLDVYSSSSSSEEEVASPGKQTNKFALLMDMDDMNL